MSGRCFRDHQRSQRHRTASTSCGYDWQLDGQMMMVMLMLMMMMMMTRSWTSSWRSAATRVETSFNTVPASGQNPPETPPPAPTKTTKNGNNNNNDNKNNESPANWKRKFHAAETLALRVMMLLAVSVLNFSVVALLRLARLFLFCLYGRGRQKHAGPSFRVPPTPFYELRYKGKATASSMRRRDDVGVLVKNKQNDSGTIIFENVSWILLPHWLGLFASTGYINSVHSSFSSIG